MSLLYSLSSLLAVRKQLADLGVITVDQLENTAHPLEPSILDKIAADTFRCRPLSMAHLGVFPPVYLGHLDLGILGSLHVNILAAAMAESLNDLSSLGGLDVGPSLSSKVRRGNERQPCRRRDAVEVLQMIIVG